MRKTLTRAAVAIAGAALAAAVLPPGTAAAAYSGDCPEAASTRLLTVSVLGARPEKLWVYSPDATTTYVCFDFFGTDALAIGGGVIIARAGSGVVAPSVVVGTDPAVCSIAVIDAADPVRLRLMTSAGGSTVCLTVGSSTTTLTFGLPGVSELPSVEVWRDGRSTLLDTAACAPEFAERLVGDGTPYFVCSGTIQRIV